MEYQNPSLCLDQFVKVVHSRPSIGALEPSQVKGGPCFTRNYTAQYNYLSRIHCLCNEQ